MRFLLLLISLLGLYLASSDTKQNSLKSALTFYASFDESADADFALGDASIYTANDYDKISQASKGLRSPTIKLESVGGVSGGCLQFENKSDQLVLFKAADNLHYTKDSWSGSISFWLRLDPDQDLAPGYCDPIQITDAGYDDASLWVDFSDQNPRDFRMGVFGDAKVWNPAGGEGGDHPDFMKRLVPAQNKPFDRDSWTHIVIRFSELNTDEGSAQLYINAALQGSQDSIDEPFSWNLDKATIRLGISYVGLMDELSLYNRALSESEIMKLYQLEGGVKSIL